jgi:cell division protein FtsL
MILLCLLLLAAAAGRYQAEVAVRETRRELNRLENEKARELSEIQVLRAEIAYLESPERLARIAERHTDLAPLAGAQLMTADEFLIALGSSGEQEPVGAPADVDLIRNALALADAGAMAPAGELVGAR